MNDLEKKLRDAGLRPTKQRLLISHYLFSGPQMHVTADSLYSELIDRDINISLATIYNVLNVFTSYGLLKEISIDPSRSYFDTNIKRHYHYYFEKTGKLEEAEKYYLEGLKIKPDHNGINEYLGELYVNTDRIEQAKERLAVLKNCNCEEYSELKEIIEKK